MLNNNINLEVFRAIDAVKNKKSKVFTGRDRGEFIRKKSNLDKIENEHASVNIIIPDDIYSINPSFFEELFVNVVQKLGKEEFMKKFVFTSEGDYNYQKPLQEAIERILRKKTALD